MKSEKKEKIKSRQQVAQLGESVRILNIINLVVIVGGVLLYYFSTGALMTKIGSGLIMAGAIMVVATIVIQLYFTSKLRKKK
ncbi:hypothetical protein [Methanolapillus millepedarum]|uniref:Uncharacterized protein n=1 Tax=Methanolapillus millepedarum TaxID=3028296 RepID=A0AA96V5A3_9EURY|nr:hypothetical protein MsAc7_13940 [Methanosarcinaceae archaeon Ac7]